MSDRPRRNQARLQGELHMAMLSMHEHFSEIANVYRDLRMTDREPIACIALRLRRVPRIRAADVGCGAGRYSLKLFQHLGQRIKHLHCIDINHLMLEQVRSHLRKHDVQHFEGVRSVERHLPLPSDHLDCIFTFNAVHHFDITGFLSECSRVLRRRGFLFVYTRFRGQNSRNIWGKHFPLFHEKETRLYETGELEGHVSATPRMRMENVQIFEYPRFSTLDRLLELAANRHYSTFSLYSESELEASLTQFESNIRRNFEDPDEVRWSDENVMLTIRKD